jgi:hypothetical protein
MYSDLISILRKEDYYIEIKISDLENCCCSESKANGLDVIAVKQKFYAVTQKAPPKTVKAILFSDGNKLFFVQTEKYYSEFANHSIQWVLNAYFTDKNELKIEGTLQTLSDMLKHYNISKDFETFFQISKRDKIQTIILTKITEGQYLALQIGLLDEWHLKTPHSILGRRILMDCKDFERYFG